TWMDGKIYIAVVEDKLVLSGNKDVVMKLSKGGTITVEAAKSLLSHAGSAYLDVKSLLSYLRSTTGMDDFNGSNYIDLFDTASMTTDNSKGVFRLVLKNKDVNALKQIIDVILRENPGFLSAGGLMM